MEYDDVLHPRYQDLTREQAYGFEARVVQRLLPLLFPKSKANMSSISNYFSKLSDLVYMLAEIGTGELLLEDVEPIALEYHQRLSQYEILDQKSIIAADAILGITDALGDLGLVRYIPKPGLPSRELQNPDLSILMTTGAFCLKKWGMKEGAFIIPAMLDFEFVFSQNGSKDVFLTSSFFQRDLWPQQDDQWLKNSMPPAFKDIIQADWLKYFHEIGLGGIAHGYESFLTGINIGPRNRDTTTGGGTVVNNITFNFDNGSNLTGSVTIIDEFQSAYKEARETQKEDLKTKLKHTVEVVGQLVNSIDSEDEKNEVATHLKTFVEQAKKEKPSKSMLNFTSQGLLNAAKTVASMSAPVTTAVKAVLSLINP